VTVPADTGFLAYSCWLLLLVCLVITALLAFPLKLIFQPLLAFLLVVVLMLLLASHANIGIPPLPRERAELEFLKSLWGLGTEEE
jgi:hypothetical protein